MFGSKGPVAIVVRVGVFKKKNKKKSEHFSEKCVYCTFTYIILRYIGEIAEH